MNSQNELLKQQLIEAISCQNLQEIQKILSLAQLEDETLSALASAEIQGLEFNGLVVFEDLLMALGKANVSIVKQSDLTLENLRLLDQVWTGENMRVFELISILEKDGGRDF